MMSFLKILGALCLVVLVGVAWQSSSSPDANASQQTTLATDESADGAEACCCGEVCLCKTCDCDGETCTECQCVGADGDACDCSACECDGQCGVDGSCCEAKTCCDSGECCTETCGKDGCCAEECCESDCCLGGADCCQDSPLKSPSKDDAV